MKVDTNKTFIEDAMSYASQETRERVADALYCHLHNTGQTLAGNTQESDVEWFARIMWEDRDRRHGERWDNESETTKGLFREFAALAIKMMPRIQNRIASRLIELSKVMEDINRAEREATKKLKRKGQ